MSTILEIEQAVRKLEPNDLVRLRGWFAKFDAESWDRQIEGDSASGRLNELGEEALRDMDEGCCTEL
jgi:hypothetical protein